MKAAVIALLLSASVAGAAVAGTPRVLRVYADGPTLWLATTTGLYELDGERRLQRVWSEADGLPSAAVADVSSRHGALWVATPRGIAYRDGDRFVVSNQGLPSTDVTCLLASKGGELYAGTARGIAHRVGEDWKPRYEAHQFGRDRVIAVAEAADSTLWFAKLWSLAILQPDGGARVMWRDPLNPDAAVELPSTAAQALAFDAQQRLWIAHEAGISVLDGSRLVADERWRPGVWGIDGIPGMRVWSIFHARDGKTWISFGDGPDKGFVASRSGISGAWRRHAVGDSAAVAAYGFAEDDRGVLWLGTSAGLYRLQGEGFETWGLTK